MIEKIIEKLKKLLPFWFALGFDLIFIINRICHYSDCYFFKLNAYNFSDILFGIGFLIVTILLLHSCIKDNMYTPTKPIKIAWVTSGVFIVVGIVFEIIKLIVGIE